MSFISKILHSKNHSSLISRYEKKIYDLQQLIEISKSLNSTLDYNQLVQSILYICMGQLQVFEAGLYTRKDIDNQNLSLHRSVVGFEFEQDVDFTIPETHPILHYLQENFRCHKFSQLVKDFPSLKDLKAISSFSPFLVVPLKAKTIINGILMLGEPIRGKDFTAENLEYLMDITTLAGIAVQNAFLYEITTTDVMTKLKLRHFFIDILQDSLIHTQKEQSKLNLAMMDIDHFKVLNDSYGHLCGDYVLKTVAKMLLENVRQSDLAARYGGEEFVLLLPHTDTNTAMAICERIRLCISEYDFQYEGHTIHVTISIGITEYIPSKDLNANAVISRADEALYDSKHAGRNAVSVR